MKPRRPPTAPLARFPGGGSLAPLVPCVRAAPLVLGALLAVGALSCAAAREHLPPALPGLPFSNAVRDGDTIWLSGHIGLPEGERRPPEDPAREARLALEGMLASLRAAGGEPADLVRVTVFCSDVELYDAFNAVYRELVAEPFPARAFVGSGDLLFGCRFEVMGVARVR